MVKQNRKGGKEGSTGSMVGMAGMGAWECGRMGVQT